MQRKIMYILRVALKLMLLKKEKKKPEFLLRCPVALPLQIEQIRSETVRQSVEYPESLERNTIKYLS